MSGIGKPTRRFPARSRRSQQASDFLKSGHSGSVAARAKCVANLGSGPTHHAGKGAPDSQRVGPSPACRRARQRSRAGARAMPAAIELHPRHECKHRTPRRRSDRQCGGERSGVIAGTDVERGDIEARGSRCFTSSPVCWNWRCTATCRWASSPRYRASVQFRRTAFRRPCPFPCTCRSQPQCCLARSRARLRI